MKIKVTLEEVREYNLLLPMLTGLLKEVRELSKKKQEELLNKNKVRMINNILTRIKELLKDETSHDFLELLDDDSLPSNSDALFIMVQFDSAMLQFKSRYYRVDRLGHGTWLKE